MKFTYIKNLKVRFFNYVDVIPRYTEEEVLILKNLVEDSEHERYGSMNFYHIVDPEDLASSDSFYKFLKSNPLRQSILKEPFERLPLLINKCGPTYKGIWKTLVVRWRLQIGK